MRIILYIPVFIALLGIQVSPSVPTEAKGLFDLAAVVGAIVFIWRKFNSIHKTQNDNHTTIMSHLSDWRVEQTEHIARLEQGQSNQVEKLNTVIAKAEIQGKKTEKLEDQVKKIAFEHNVFHKQHLIQEGDNQP